MSILFACETYSLAAHYSSSQLLRQHHTFCYSYFSFWQPLSWKYKLLYLLVNLNYWINLTKTMCNMKSSWMFLSADGLFPGSVSRIQVHFIFQPYYFWHKTSEITMPPILIWLILRNHQKLQSWIGNFYEPELKVVYFAFNDIIPAPNYNIIWKT